MLYVKPKQAGTCGRSIRNEHTSKSLICTNIKCYRTNSIVLLSRLYAILLSIAKKTARKWKFGKIPPTKIPPSDNSTHVKFHPRKIPPSESSTHVNSTQFSIPRI